MTVQRAKMFVISNSPAGI